MTVPTWFLRSEYWQEVRAEGEAKGEARGEAKSILRLLGLRGIAVPDDARARIGSCTDHDQLAAWFDRALGADSIDDLFA
ncbi:hypothetical protein [Nocardia pseudovaccinii]|uniref:hypothetical protein n=1 Tax=Nocardia pseudovaccinii TaxID=189540 RepID=UPI0007A49CD2|nr:hypothetical protein [Nocardia pseudovaccinii]